MPKVFGLDIPPALVDFYTKILMQMTGVSSGNLATQGPRLSRAAQSNLILRSLFVLWAPLFDSFTSTRREAWKAYWQTLPYGSHSGGGGWPGSGFSAFVHVNAPRYRAHLDLLLDPPMFDGGLVLNPQFINGLDYWEIWDPSLEQVIDEQFNFLANDWTDLDSIPLIQDLPALVEANYRVQFDASIPDGNPPDFGSGYDTYLICNLGFFEVGFQDLDEYPNRIIVPTNHSVPTHYSFDIPSWYDDGYGDFDTHIFFSVTGCPFDIYWNEETSSYGGSPIILDNVSVIKL